MSDQTNNGSPASQAHTEKTGTTSGGGIDGGSMAPGALVREVQKQREEIMFLSKVFWSIAGVLAHVMSYPALILFRRDLGERMLSKPALLVTWLIAAFITVATNVGIGYSIALGMPILYAVHAFRARRRKNRGERHYSFSRGTSWLDKFLPSRSDLNARFSEPILLIVTAVAVYLFSDQMLLTPAAAGIGGQQFGSWLFSLYLALIGLSLACVESRLRTKDRDTILTHIDQQIISTYLASALNETLEIEDEGFAIAELANWNPEALSTALSLSSGSLDAQWQDILDPAPGSTEKWVNQHEEALV